MGIVGIFFDPPYGVEDRDQNIYHCESVSVSKDVERWCLERGNRTDHRIVIAGYDTEYAALIKAGWKQHRLSTDGGYGKISRKEKESRGQTNRHREMLLFSPYCNSSDRLVQNDLWGG